MSYHSSDKVSRALGVSLSNLGPKELRCIHNAVWDRDLKRYLSPVQCSRCLGVYHELLTIALGAARGEVRAVCIKCDDAARISSAVTRVIITG